VRIKNNEASPIWSGFGTAFEEMAKESPIEHASTLKAVESGRPTSRQRTPQSNHQSRREKTHLADYGGEDYISSDTDSDYAGSPSKNVLRGVLSAGTINQV
jgi:hypothetical protein